MPKVKRKDRTQSVGVPMELQDDEHFCCEDCPRFYKMEWDLKVHKLKHCGRVGYNLGSVEGVMQPLLRKLLSENM